MADLEPLDWHFIGRLQANKAKGGAASFRHDPLRRQRALAERLQRSPSEEGLQAPGCFCR